MSSGLPPTTRLKDFAYYGTGGTARRIFAPESVAALQAAVRTAAGEGLELMLLGGGTNSLVLDEPFAGAVILFHKLQRLTISGATLVAGAGVGNTQIALAAQQSGLTGAAWMYRLPGQIGGTTRMNARCYGGEISQIVTKVVSVGRDGARREWTDRAAMFRGYKDTVFMGNGELLAEVELQLAATSDKAADARQMAFCEQDREGKGQFVWPSCGCVFKNDHRHGVPSGMLLEAAGAKALRCGGAEVSPQHANFVFNKGATSADILALTFAMREAVYDRFGIWLEYEMEVLGTMAPEAARRFKEVRPQIPHEKELAPLRAKFAAKAAGATGSGSKS